MAVTVYISHSGQYLAYPETSTLTIHALQAWIEKQADVPISRQILLTLAGKSVKTLNSTAEIYVYDKKNLSATADVPAEQDEHLSGLPIIPPPPAGASLEQCKKAAEEARNWALESSEVIRAGAGRTETLLCEADAIYSSIIAALSNLKNSLKTTNQKFEAIEAWALAEVEKAYAMLSAPGNCKKQLQQLRQDTTSIEKYLFNAPESDSAIVEEAETIAGRIVSDCDNILSLGDESTSFGQASRKLSLFWSDYAPTMITIMDELQEKFRSLAQDSRNLAVNNYYAALREISDVQSRLSTLRSDIADLAHEVQEMAAPTGDADGAGADSRADMVDHEVEAIAAQAQVAVVAAAGSRDDLVDAEKVRLEARLRASESRVRKLEDLLHRQSHENASVQRIGALEAQVQKLQNEAYDERRSSTESRDKMQEAESVKQDLMANFDAQRQEFDEERQLMDDENHKLKIRIEELEDELDRILGSRDHLKQTNDQKFAGLKSELDSTRDAQREAEQKSKIQIENLEKDVNVQLERVAHLERQLRECREERRTGRDENEAEVSRLRAALEEERTQRKAVRDELESVQGDISGMRSRLASGARAKELSDLLINYNDRVIRMLTQFGFSISRTGDSLVIQRASKVGASTTLASMSNLESPDTPAAAAMNQRVSQIVAMANSSTLGGHDSVDPILPDPEWAQWASENQAEEDAKFALFKTAIESLDFPSAIDTMVKRYKDVESLAKKYQKDSRAYRDKAHRLQVEAHDKIAYRSFKDGDLALFLPTRNQATRPWAAFNVGAPHYFLREQDHHKLQSRDWLLARISKVEERVVDLSRSLSTTRGEASTHAEAGDTASARSVEDENPFELSDGLRWYLLDAAEEKPGAPGTPSVGKSTVTASNVEAEATMGRKEKTPGKGPNAAQVAKTLNKSLESRRSSSASKRSGSLKRDSASGRDGGAPAPLTTADSSLAAANEAPAQMVKPGDSYHGPAREDARVFDIQHEDSRATRTKRSWDRLFSIEYNG